MNPRSVLIAGMLLMSALCSAQVTCPVGVNHCAQASWTANSVGGTSTGYNVYDSTTNGGCATLTATTCTKVGSTIAPTANLMVSPLNKTTTYYFVITATNSTGETACSPQLSGPTGDYLPGVPQTIIIQIK